MAKDPKQVKGRLRIILDSNAFFVPLQFKVDIFEELERLINMRFELVLLSPIRQELEKLAKEGSPKLSKSASCALKLAERCSTAELERASADSADNIIVEAARRWNCPVFTNDRRLRKRLRDINVPVIYVRQKSRLEIDGRI